MSKLDLILEILNDTLPIPDWRDEPHAERDLLEAGVPHFVVQHWLALKIQHGWEMSVELWCRRN